jgi:hypothetical protein
MERAIEITVLVILVAGALSGAGHTENFNTNQTDSAFYNEEQAYFASEDAVYDTAIYKGPYDERYMGFNDNETGYQYYLEDYNRYFAN